MGRGRLMRTKKHEVVILTKAEEKARFQQEYANKMSEHGFLMSLRGHIGKAIDKVDPLELAAIAGLTIIIEPMIEQEIRAVVITTNTAVNLIKMAEPFFSVFGIFQQTAEGIVNAISAGTSAVLVYAQTDNPKPHYIKVQVGTSPGGTIGKGTEPQPIYENQVNPEWTAWNNQYVGQQKVMDDLSKISLWITAFVIAFCIVRWGDKMINAGIGGISGILKLAGLVAA